MIEIAKTLANPEKLAAWLEQVVRPHLTPDVSNYARGRLRCWFRTEPPLSPTRPFLPGLPVDDQVWSRLAELVEWDFDYALVTYSGDERAAGIRPHRDASYADYEARAIHISGECRFDYWMGREAFGCAASKREHLPGRDPPTHQLLLSPGDVVRFNCKNLHAATPGVRRWNLNLWRQKER